MGFLNGAKLLNIIACFSILMFNFWNHSFQFLTPMIYCHCLLGSIIMAVCVEGLRLSDPGIYIRYGDDGMLETVITAPYQIETRDVPIPQIKSGEVLVRMKRAGICGSDIQVYHGLHKYMEYPLVQGHEGTGYVVEVGADVRGLEVGDLVVMQPQFACGECFACKKGRENVCESLKHYGISVPGLYAEYVAVREWNAVKMPRELDPECSVFVEPFSIACNAMYQGHVKAGDRVVVIGAGQIGNFVAQAAKLFGAEVLIADMIQSKLDLARSHGIHHCINIKEEPLKDAIHRVFGTKGVHVIFECAAVESSFTQAIECATKSSSIVVVGGFKKPYLLEIPLLQRREVSLHGVMGTSRATFLQSADFISRNQVDLTGAISARFPLKNLARAYEYIDQVGNTMKVLLEI